MGRTESANNVVYDEPATSNSALVASCLSGDQDAWATLIARHKRLIFSIPIKQGYNHDEADDIFQAVCLDLVAELPRLREPEALPQWLIRATVHKCSRHRVYRQRFGSAGGVSVDVPDPDADFPESTLQEVQQAQVLREAVRALSSRCRRMVEMLFFETPAVPYAEVAARLGLATGSIGFIRARCLDRLRAAVSKAGL
jgi:RNA polymerase sigma factor (sigma-70 family)